MGPQIEAFKLTSNPREEALGLSGALADCKKPLDDRKKP